jgi:hypothetical protein
MNLSLKSLPALVISLLTLSPLSLAKMPEASSEDQGADAPRQGKTECLITPVFGASRIRKESLDEIS